MPTPRPNEVDNFEPITARSVVALRPSDPTVRSIRTAWRRLTGGQGVRDADRPTLIACSGGVDSSSLVLALATVPRKPVVAHVVHDLRPAAEALADRDATRALAESLGLEFAEASISVADSTQSNAESAARELRYDALCSMAGHRGIRWIATGHHADDQAETLLMRLIRGAGPGGLVGVHPSRPIGDQTIIRPMLSITRADNERLCAQAGVSCCHDASNEDQSLLRAAIRARVGPVLEELAPGASTRIAQAAQLQNELLAVLDEATDQLIKQAGVDPEKPGEPKLVTLGRAPLAGARRVVLARLLQRLTGDTGRDRSGKRVLDAITDAIGDDNPAPPTPRDFTLSGAQIRVLGHTIEISPAAR